jgi:hypothetical protein
MPAVSWFSWVPSGDIGTKEPSTPMEGSLQIIRLEDHLSGGFNPPRQRPQGLSLTQAILPPPSAEAWQSRAEHQPALPPLSTPQSQTQFPFPKVRRIRFTETGRHLPVYPGNNPKSPGSPSDGNL